MVIIKVENLALLKGYDYAMRENFWEYSAIMANYEDSSNLIEGSNHNPLFLIQAYWIWNYNRNNHRAKLLSLLYKNITI